MNFRAFLGLLLIFSIISILVLTSCGTHTYDNLQQKIAEVDSILIKGVQAGLSDHDSLRNEQKLLAEKYTAKMIPDQVPESDLFAAAQLYYFSEQFDKAVQVMERKPIDDADIDFLDLLFQLYVYEGEIAKSEDLFQSHILEKQPPKIENYYSYMQYGYIEEGEFENALRVVDNAIENVDSTLTVSLLLDKAELFITMNDSKKALDIINQAESIANLTPNNLKKIAAKRQLIEMVGKPATELQVDNWLGSAPLPLKSLKGKVVLLDFWAPWCPPCRDILPFLQSLYEEYGDQGFQAIGVTQYYGYFNQLGKNLKNISPEREEEWVKKFKENMNISIPTAISNSSDGAANARAFGVYGIPHMVLIDKKGNVRLYTIGSGKSSEEKLENGVIELLKETL